MNTTLYAYTATVLFLGWVAFIATFTIGYRTGMLVRGNK